MCSEWIPRQFEDEEYCSETSLCEATVMKFISHHVASNTRLQTVDYEPCTCVRVVLPAHVFPLPDARSD
jgi:hypothetical protein